MSSSQTYLDRAWKDLSSDEGWWKAIFAFGILNCIPVIGQIIMYGYLFDWAKEAAWGMNIPLTRQLGDLGRRVKYGFTALWVLIIWIAPVLIIAWLVSFIPTVGGVLSFLMQVCAILVGAIGAAGALRSLIYEHVMPGLQVGRVLKMARKDPGGLAQSFSIILLVLPLLFAALLIVMLPSVPFISLIASVTLSSALGSDLALLVFLGMLTMVVALMVWVAGAIVSALISALYVRALGYWMEQFKPAEWKSPTAPMPFELELEAKKAQKAQSKKDAKAAKKQAKKEAKRQGGESPESPATSEEDQKPNDD